MTSAVGAENLFLILSTKDHATRSGGAESNPICGIIMLPLALAVLSYFLIMSATNGISPVTSR